MGRRAGRSPADWTRRTALAATLASLALPARAGIWPIPSGIPGIDQRHLWIRQAGRREILHVAFREIDGSPRIAGVQALSWLFRDWKAGNAITWIDIRLFDLLAGMQTFLTIRARAAAQLVLTSGYRTPRRNAGIEGAAANSQHIHGRAADIFVPGLAQDEVRNAARIAGAPGLGAYPAFTHVDVGPAGRSWSS